jgi:hypothetical protein
MYDLDDEDLAAIAARFGVELDRSLLKAANLAINLHRWHRIYEVPYLIHTRYELPLLLDGRKKLARMPYEYPPMKFDVRIDSITGSRKACCTGKRSSIRSTLP